MKDDPPEAIRDVKESAWKEVNDFVKKERSHSAPGPNGVPYIVYKKCPALLVATFPSNIEKRNNNYQHVGKSQRVPKENNKSPTSSLEL